MRPGTLPGRMTGAVMRAGAGACMTRMRVVRRTALAGSGRSFGTACFRASFFQIEIPDIFFQFPAEILEISFWNLISHIV